jgi:hypothetical protein
MPTDATSENMENFPQPIPRHEFLTMAKSSKMPLRDVQAIVNSSRTNALAAMSAMNLSEDRAEALDYYLGHMEAVGRTFSDRKLPHLR